MTYLQDTEIPLFYLRYPTVFLQVIKQLFMPSTYLIVLYYITKCYYTFDHLDVIFRPLVHMKPKLQLNIFVLS
jgi:hypothetical protein